MSDSAGFPGINSGVLLLAAVAGFHVGVLVAWVSLYNQAGMGAQVAVWAIIAGCTTLFTALAYRVMRVRAR